MRESTLDIFLDSIFEENPFTVDELFKELGFSFSDRVRLQEGTYER